MKNSNPIPAAVRRSYPLAIEAIVTAAFTPGKGWVLTRTSERMTAKVADRMKREGVTAVALTVTCTDGIATFDRHPSFQVAELATPPKPKAPSNEALADLTPDELLGVHKAHPRSARVWDALIAAVLADDSPARRGRLTACDNGHSKGLMRLTRKPRGGMRYQTWIRSRQAWTKTTYASHAFSV